MEVVILKRFNISIILCLLFAMLLSTSIAAEVTVDDESYFAKFRGQGISLNV